MRKVGYLQGSIINTKSLLLILDSNRQKMIKIDLCVIHSLTHSHQSVINYYGE